MFWIDVGFGVMIKTEGYNDLLRLINNDLRYRSNCLYLHYLFNTKLLENLDK